jgi:hypothetical protein
MSKLDWAKLVTGVAFMIIFILITTSMTFNDMMRINPFFPIFLLWAGLLNCALIADSVKHIRINENNRKHENVT